MKLISILICAVAFQINAMSQKMTESTVPTAVKNSFTTMFKNTTVTQWQMDNGNYEATYMKDGVENAVIYSADGKFVHYKNTITSNDLPEAARKYITINCSGKKMGAMTRIKVITGEVSYDVKVFDIESEASDYWFDAKGNFVKITVKLDEK